MVDESMDKEQKITALSPGNSEQAGLATADHHDWWCYCKYFTGFYYLCHDLNGMGRKESALLPLNMALPLMIPILKILVSKTAINKLLAVDNKPVDEFTETIKKLLIDSMVMIIREGQQMTFTCRLT